MDHKRDKFTYEQSQSRVPSLRFQIKQVCLEMNIFPFLVVETQFYKKLCPLVHWSISQSVHHSRVKNEKNDKVIMQILLCGYV